MHTSGTEPTNREQGPIDSKRRHHAIDSGPIGKARIDPWRCAINSQTKRSNDSFEQGIGGRTVNNHASAFEVSVAFNPKVAGTVDHHFIDRGICEKRIENSEATHTRMNSTHDIGNRLIVEQWIVIENELCNRRRIVIAFIKQLLMHGLD
jgi:hypothetical protein